MQYHFLLSYFLVFIAISYSIFKGLGLEKQIIINSLRALVQLFLLGLFLSYIFALEGVMYYLLVFVFMLLFAAYTAYKRVGSFLIGFAAMGLASFLVLATLLTLQIISFNANELIPVGGMIIGNSLNIYTIFVDRYKNEITQNKPVIEQYLALGITQDAALSDINKKSIKAALIPIMNTLQTVGIIHIPGIMAGMIIAGADPMSAVMYQVVIMYMMLAVSLFTAIFAIMFLQKNLLRF
ncbi:MAG: ABC transporter permease [Campylobacterota bacterium]